ncbi:MAG: hypothetical protein ACJA01_000547 [Saprospiraceae bacterium]|jgi:hypothetical protein
MAQTCCSGGVPVNSNLGFQSSDKGGVQLSLSADFNILKTLKSGSRKLDDNDRLRSTQSYILRGAYSISKRWTIEGFLPIVRQTRRITTSSGAFDREETSGVGDPVLLGIYNVIQKAFVLRVGAGPQFPLGAYNKLGSRGLLLFEDLQPGSGAWDMIFLASAEYSLFSRPSSLLYLNAIMSQTGINKNSRGGTQAYEFGNDVQVIAGYSDQLLIGNQILSPGVALRYRYADRDEVNQIKLPGTGGSFVFARISNSIPFPQLKSSLAVNLEVPIWNKINETQLTPSFGINVSWYLKLESKKAYLSIIE